MNDLFLFDADSRGVARVRLNRPDVHNAFNDILIQALADLFEDLATQDGLRALVLTGEGRSFSAGGDLEWMRRAAAYDYDRNLSDAQDLARLMRALDQLPMPTIAAVNGAAMGGGVGLVACCDIAVGVSGAHFALSEVRLGLIPAVISPYVVRALGERAASRYFLTGERFDAENARRMGLLHECVADLAALHDKVEEIIAAVLASGPQSTRAAKSLLRHVAGRPIDAGLIQETANRIATQRATDEAREGLAAFFEKRKPNWTA